MAKVIAKEVNEIVAPPSIASLHNLNELAEQEKIFLHLQENLDKYKKDYFRSFFKSNLEVLDFIPDSKAKKYCTNFNSTKSLTLKEVVDRLAPEPHHRLIVNTVKHKIYTLPSMIERNIKGTFNEDYTEFKVVIVVAQTEWYNYNEHVGDHYYTYTFDVRKNTIIKHTKTYRKFNPKPWDH